MPATRWLAGLAWLGALALPAQAADRDDPGRREFPLKYRLAGYTISEEVGHGGQHLRPGPSRPPALKEEPKYRSRTPLYATARLGAGRDDFTLILDSSAGEARGHNVLYVDADRDGRIT